MGVAIRQALCHTLEYFTRILSLLPPKSITAGLPYYVKSKLLDISKCIYLQLRSLAYAETFKRTCLFLSILSSINMLRVTLVHLAFHLQNFRSYTNERIKDL